MCRRAPTSMLWRCSSGGPGTRGKDAACPWPMGGAKKKQKPAADESDNRSHIVVQSAGANDPLLDELRTNFYTKQMPPNTPSE